MATPGPHASSKVRPIPSLRWWIGGLLFASTVINYIDRQTLSLLAPYLKLEYRWTNTDYEHRDRFPGRVFRWSDCLRQTHGSGRYPPRSDPHRHLVFDDLDADVLSKWLL